jgi:hypothetical protein
VFERLRDAFRAALDAAGSGRGGDLRELTARMREAVVEAKVGVREIRDALARSEAELASERTQLADAERRGRLAAEIQDQETVTVAERFAARHREHVAVLERKVAAQRDELALAERDLAEMQAQLERAARERGPAGAAARSADAAWRDIEAAGGARPGVDPKDELLRADLDRQRREAQADRQLEELKKRMKKD